MLINFYNNNPNNALLALLPIIFTGLVFLLVVFVQGISVDIPLAFSAFRGFGRPWSLKLLYTSNIPIIFAWAFLTNLQLISRVGLRSVNGEMCGPFGCFDVNGNAVSGFAYYISSPRNIISLISEGFGVEEVIRIVVHSIIMILLAIVFSVIWVETSGMNAKSLAEQLTIIGMQIPGYRRDSRVIESVLNKYIPPLSVLGGLIVGILAIIGELFGVIGGGMGLLLSVMIIYNYFELIKSEDMEEMPGYIKKLLGG